MAISIVPGLMEESRREPWSLSSALMVLRRRRLVFLLALVLAPASALAFSLSQQNQYSASASLLFRDAGLDAKLFDSSPFQPSADPDREAQTNLRLVSLDVVAERTARRLGGRLSADDVSRKVAVRQEGASNVVTVTATDPSPRLAAAVANTFAGEFIAFRREADRAKIREAQELVQRELSSLREQRSSGQSRRGRQRPDTRVRDLQRRAEQLGILASLQTGNAELVEPADVPSERSSPKTVSNVLVGGIVGLVLGVGLAFLVDALDRTLKDADEIAAIFDRPVLAELPPSKAVRKSSPALPPGEAEAFRMLRTNLLYFNVDREIKSVAITSAVKGEGKSTVAWNLAVASALSGSDVLLIEVDLRQPTFSDRLTGSSQGLSDVLSRDCPVKDATLSVRLSSANGPGATARTMDVLPCGPLPPNPADLLASRRMGALVDAMESAYDLVLIDTPPVSLVADAIPVLNKASGVLVVTRVGVTERRAAAHLRRHLEDLNISVLGVVVNDVRNRLQAYYGYSTRTTNVPKSVASMITRWASGSTSTSGERPQSGS